MTSDPKSVLLQVTAPARELKRRAEAHHHRGLLVLSGEMAWCRQQAAALCEALGTEMALWVGTAAPDGIASIENRRALEHLGRELELLIYDAFAGFDPDAFGALGGTLRGGGLLLLLTPPLPRWHDYPDPEHRRVAVAGYGPEAIPGHFLRRLAGILQRDPRALLISDTAPPRTPPPAPPATPPATQDFGICRSGDQQRAVAAILHLARGHRRRPLVLSADRGRGKSAALGIAAAELLREGSRRILVTGPRRSAADSLFAQVRRLLPESKRRGDRVMLGEALLDYSAPDHLLARRPPAELLLVDEAAAIPTPLLEGLLEAYPRIVFATTIHGYEGTGRGFALRFKAHLDRHTPQWRELRLRQPIRWAADDPLEGLLFRLLALDARPAVDASVREATPESVRVEHFSPARLLQNEEELQQLFGLLVLAHYRTTPLDLRHLLDGPNLQILLLRQGSALAGVALLAAEGNFEKALAAQIWAGYRRPRGHLLAQSLAAHVGLPSAPELRGLRVMRIAIHPAAQRRGLGRRLLTEIRTFAANRGFDYLGSSFGASEALLDFWSRGGYRPVRLGLQCGASSGGHSVIFIDPISSAGREMATAAVARFGRQLPALLGDPLAGLSPELAAKLFAAGGDAPPLPIEADEWRDLAGFAYARRSYESSLPGIWKLSLLGLRSGELAPREARLLILRVMQRRPWPECARLCGFGGRGETEGWLRQILGGLIKGHGDPRLRELMPEPNGA